LSESDRNARAEINEQRAVKPGPVPQRQAGRQATARPAAILPV